MNLLEKIRWRVRYAKHFKAKAGITFRQGMYLSGIAVDERLHEEETPESAADIELSYWADG